MHNRSRRKAGRRPRNATAQQLLLLCARPLCRRLIVHPPPFDPSTYSTSSISSGLACCSAVDPSSSVELSRVIIVHSSQDCLVLNFFASHRLSSAVLASSRLSFSYFFFFCQPYSPSFPSFEYGSYRLGVVSIRYPNDVHVHVPFAQKKAHTLTNARISCAGADPEQFPTQDERLGGTPGDQRIRRES